MPPRRPAGIGAAALFDPETDAALDRELDAVSEAYAANDFARALVRLHAALSIFIAGRDTVLEKSGVTVAIVGAALDAATGSRRALLLYCVAVLGVALRDAGAGSEGQEWLELADAHLGTPQDDGDPLLMRIRRIVSAKLAAQCRNRGEDDTAQWPEAVAHHDMPDPRAEGTVAVLVNTVQQARQLATEGRREEGLRLVQRAVAGLDPREAQSSGFARLAMTEVEELAARTPQAARWAVHRRVALLAAMGAPAMSRAMVCMVGAFHAGQAGRRDHALHDATAALRVCAEPGAADMAWRVLGAMAEMETTFGRTRSAILLDKLAVAALCAVRKRLADFDPALGTLEDSGREVLERLAGRLVAAGRLLEAEEASVLGRIRGASQVPAPSLLRAEAEAAARLDQARSGLGGSLRSALDGLERADSSRGAASTRQDAQGAEWAQEEDGDMLSLSYVAEAGRLVCVARRGAKTRSFGLGLAPSEANRLAFSVRQRIFDLRSDPAPLLREAYGLLLQAPIRSMADGVRRIRVAAAHGALHVLPWAALHDGGRYAVERWAWVRAVPGVDLRQPPRPAARLLACAATRAGAGFPALGAAAALEAEAVARIWAAPGSRPPLLDGAFTRAGLAAAVRDASILHVASHFHPDPVQLGRSRLLLGDGTSIPLSELAGLGLSGLDLVVLSACGTAVSAMEPGAGESVSAVDAMLLAGGARSAVGTLWPVDSDATRALMEAFHGGLRATLGKDDALAQAQRALLAGKAGGGGWTHPLFWAAPVLSGNRLAWSR